MPPNKINSDGYEYGPTKKGKIYLSLYKHRGSGNHHKNVWESSITPDIEYSIFYFADENDWYDESRDYWGVLDQGKKILGMKGERISKFPCTSNESDPWHGYPASPSNENKIDKSDCPSDVLIEKWIETSVVTKEFGRKIQKLRRR